MIGARAKKNKKVLLQKGWALYERTSSAYAQAPERSQDMQRRWIESNLIKQSDLPILKEYADTMTGTTINRKDFQKMLAAARRGEFSHIAVSHVDRFGRTTKDALTVLEELWNLGITVKIAGLPDMNAADPKNAMIVTMLLAVAQNVSLLNSERVKASQLDKLLKGSFPWKAPDGYLNLEEKL